MSAKNRFDITEKIKYENIKYYACEHQVNWQNIKKKVCGNNNVDFEHTPTYH